MAIDPLILKMREKLESILDRYAERVSIAKSWDSLLIDDILVVHCPIHRAGPTARIFLGPEIGEIITEKENEPVATEWVAPILFCSEKDSYFRFCINCPILNTVIIRY